MGLPNRVKIVEVGPRDGIQNETHPVPTAFKVAFIDKLSTTGLTAIEATAFVSPSWVPQMADAAQVMKAIRRSPSIRYPVLVPNIKGLRAAMEVGATEVSVFGAASEAFSKRNINCTIDESIERFAEVCSEAEKHSIPVRGYVSCALGCPYQGEVPLASVVRVAEKLLEIGCYEVSLGDTIGVGSPGKARAMVRAVTERVPMDKIACHFHDTYGQGIANAYACLEEGVAVFDASTGGLGGCPYARGASGNVATEDLLYMLDGLGIETGVDLNRIVAAAHFISDTLGRTPSSRVARAVSRTLV